MTGADLAAGAADADARAGLGCGFLASAALAFAGFAVGAGYAVHHARWTVQPLARQDGCITDVVVTNVEVPLLFGYAIRSPKYKADR